MVGEDTVVNGADFVALDGPGVRGVQKVPNLYRVIYEQPPSQHGLEASVIYHCSERVCSPVGIK